MSYPALEVRSITKRFGSLTAVDGVSFEVFDFRTGRTRRHTPSGADADPRDLIGHGGGDEGLMRGVLADLAQPNGEPARAALREVVESHRIVFAAEQARLEKEIQKADGEIAKIDKKLANDNFVSKAPSHVIDEQRTRRADHAQAREKLAAALERLRRAG